VIAIFKVPSVKLYEINKDCGSDNVCLYCQPMYLCGNYNIGNAIGIIAYGDFRCAEIANPLIAPTYVAAYVV
jgi:hypothetical protein